MAPLLALLVALALALAAPAAEARVLPAVTQSFVGRGDADRGAIVICLLPVVVVFALLRGHLLRAAPRPGVKG